MGRNFLCAKKMSDDLRVSFILEDIIGLEEKKEEEKKETGTVVFTNDGREIFIKTKFSDMWDLWIGKEEEKK